jgi:hypothetical protein
MIEGIALSRAEALAQRERRIIPSVARDALSSLRKTCAFPAGAVFLLTTTEELTHMSAPSRRPEIRRRRARKEKLETLRKRYQKAASEAERDRIFAKVKQLSPAITRDAFTGPLEAAPA